MTVIVRPKSGPINRPMLVAALSTSAALNFWPERWSDLFDAFVPALCILVALVMGTKAALNLIKDYKLRRDLKRASVASTTYGAARTATWEEVVEAGLDKPGMGLFVGLFDNVVPLFSNAPFTLIEASPGAGKTVNFVIGSILHRARLGASLFISDVKAELAPMLVAALRQLGFEVWCINPARTHPTICGSDEINLYQPVIDAVQAGDDFRRDAIKLAIDIAEIHLPENKQGEDKNIFFRNGSRRCLIVTILTQAMLEPHRCTPADVFATLNSPTAFRERLLFLNYEIDKMLPYDGIASFLKTEAASLLARERDNAEHFGSFVEGATQTLLSFSQGGRLAGYGRGAAARMSDLRERQVICFVIAPLSHSREFMPVVSLLNMALLEAAKRNPMGHPIHIVGEEFLNYKFNDIVADMETLRGLKVSADIYIQSFQGLERKFGRPAASAIEAYCDTRIYAGLNSFDRAQRVSAMLANETVRCVNPSYGFDVKEIQIANNETGRPIMTADEILAMPRSEALVFVRGLRPLRVRMVHYGEVDPWRDLVADNPLEGGRLRAGPKFRIAYSEVGRPTDIRVTGVTPPSVSPPRRERKGVPLIRPRNFAWCIPFAAIYLAFAKIGSPHLRYAYIATGGGFLSQCEYIGASRHRINPADGICPLIAFFPSASDGGRQ